MVFGRIYSSKAVKGLRELNFEDLAGFFDKSAKISSREKVFFIHEIKFLNPLFPRILIVDEFAKLNSLNFREISKKK